MNIINENFIQDLVECWGKGLTLPSKLQTIMILKKKLLWFKRFKKKISSKVSNISPKFPLIFHSILISSLLLSLSSTSPLPVHHFFFSLQQFFSLLASLICIFMPTLSTVPWRTSILKLENGNKWIQWWAHLISL